jgi:hypothetical protein
MSPTTTQTNLTQSIDTRFLTPSVTTTRKGACECPRKERCGARNDPEAPAGGALIASARDSATDGRDQNSVQFAGGPGERGMRGADDADCGGVRAAGSRI